VNKNGYDRFPGCLCFLIPLSFSLHWITTSNLSGKHGLLEMLFIHLEKSIFTLYSRLSLTPVHQEFTRILSCEHHRYYNEWNSEKPQWILVYHGSPLDIRVLLQSIGLNVQNTRWRTKWLTISKQWQQSIKPGNRTPPAGDPVWLHGLKAHETGYERLYLPNNQKCMSSKLNSILSIHFYLSVLLLNNILTFLIILQCYC
jgi:hypothetical protein